MTKISLSYRKKNKILPLAFGVLMGLCWFFSFGRTYREIRHYHTMQNQVDQQNDELLQAQAVKMKYQRVDSLLREMSMDSLGFEDYFLQNVSLCLEGLPLTLTYDGSSQVTHTDGILTKDIVLNGDFQSIVQGIAQLEKQFFVSRLQYGKQNYTLSLAKIAK